MVSQSIMTSALEIPKISGALKEQVLRDHVAGVSGLRELLREVAADKPDAPVMDFETVAEALAEQAAVNGEMVIAAAVVVLSHSTADDVFTGACDLAVELDPGEVGFGPEHGKNCDAENADR